MRKALTLLAAEIVLTALALLIPPPTSGEKHLRDAQRDISDATRLASSVLLPLQQLNKALQTRPEGWLLQEFVWTLKDGVSISGWSSGGTEALEGAFNAKSELGGNLVTGEIKGGKRLAILVYR